MMKVGLDRVVPLFVELGWNSAGDWAAAKALGKIHSLPSTLDDEDVAALKNNKLCARLIKAVNDEESISLTGTGAEKVTKKEAKKKTTTKKTTPKKASGKKTTTKAIKKTNSRPPAKEKDAWGSPKGSGTNIINSAFLDNPTKVFTFDQLDKKLNKALSALTGRPTSLLRGRLYNLKKQAKIAEKDGKYKKKK